MRGGGLVSAGGFAATALAIAFLAAARVLLATAGAGSALAGPATTGLRSILHGWVLYVGHCLSPLFYFLRVMRFHRG